MKYCDIYFTFSEEVVTASRIKFVAEEKNQDLDFPTFILEGVD